MWCFHLFASKYSCTIAINSVLGGVLENSVDSGHIASLEEAVRSESTVLYSQKGCPAVQSK